MMANRTAKREQGQALTEYMPLIAGALLVGMILWVPLRTGIQNLLDPSLERELQGDPSDRPVGDDEPGGGGGQPGGGGPGDGDHRAGPPDDGSSGGEGGESSCVNWGGGNMGSTCDQSPYCDKTDMSGETFGTLIYPQDVPIVNLVIKAGQNQIVFPGEGDYDDGCYQVSIRTSIATWVKIGSGKNCKDVSHIQLWEVPFCSP